MSDRRPVRDALDDSLVELRFALAEADSAEPSASLRAQVLARAGALRRGGLPVEVPEWIDGAEVFRRSVQRLGGVIAELGDDDWARPARSYGTVAGVLAHLVAVEQAFGAVLAGGEDPASAGVPHTTLGDRRPDPRGSCAEWMRLADQTVGAVSGLDPQRPVSFYGLASVALDQLLVIRAFELWTHEEDIRRGVDRAPVDPDPSTLFRMTDVALGLLPGAIARRGRARIGAGVRLVLLGPGGMTRDVALDGSSGPVSDGSRVIIETATFCRVVGGLVPLAESGAVLEGDTSIGHEFLAAAAALALD